MAPEYESSLTQGQSANLRGVCCQTRVTLQIIGVAGNGPFVVSGGEVDAEDGVVVTHAIEVAAL